MDHTAGVLFYCPYPLSPLLKTIVVCEFLLILGIPTLLFYCHHDIDISCSEKNILITFESTVLNFATDIYGTWSTKRSKLSLIWEIFRHLLPATLYQITALFSSLPFCLFLSTLWPVKVSKVTHLSSSSSPLLHHLPCPPSLTHHPPRYRINVTF